MQASPGSSSFAGLLKTHSFRGSIPLLALAFTAIAGHHALAQGNPANYVSPPSTPYVFIGDLRTLPPSPPRNESSLQQKETDQGFPVAPPRANGAADPLLNTSRPAPGNGFSQPFTTPGPNMNGQLGDGPPDANLSVGPNHVIQIVNFTYQIYDKSGNTLAGPFDPQSIWVGAGAPATDPCRIRGRGDTYVNYDNLADRWVISELANINRPPPATLNVEYIPLSKAPNPAPTS